MCLVMFTYAGWLARQVMGFLTQLFVAIGCTKEECLYSRLFEYGCLHLGWRQGDYSSGGGLGS